MSPGPQRSVNLVAGRKHPNSITVFAIVIAFAWLISKLVLGLQSPWADRASTIFLAILWVRERLVTRVVYEVAPKESPRVRTLSLMCIITGGP
ncbi:hypothetical protein BCR34DRAFT_605190 [Clohesyomyces aquaticus]|uniref:Uncharacterized protein n=1 Tax=Clohesyomyces aquaticus TaxID=1231657 RepID=A0A1Y1YZV9_9PLEO|nr:hypothetical protein BCR34DRAFT_605190 [Clohesyomyces aquaticus]